VNLVRTFPSAKFICFHAILGMIITSHTPKYEPAKKRQIYSLWFNNTDYLSVFPVPLTNYDTA